MSNFSVRRMYLTKIVMLGNGGVGKSCATIQFCQNMFIPEYDPTIENSYRKQVEVDGVVRVLEILDTAGQEEYTVMRDQHLRAGHGFVLMYSVINLPSFLSIPELFEDLKRAKDDEQAPAILIGNKFDAANEREVPTEQGMKLARQLEIPFMEVSARTRVNIDEMFIAIIREIDQRDRIRSARRASARATAQPNDQQPASGRSRFQTLRKKLNTPTKCIIL